jgi:two-component sensor histidine kinase
VNIYEALKNTEWRFAEYFKYKFPDLRYDQSRPLKTEQDFLNLVARKSMNPFLNWEKTQEYKNLLMLYLDTKIADDFQEVYSIVSNKAKQGDEKAIKLFLQLQKEVSSMAKLSAKTFESIEDETEDDELELD